MQVAVAEPGDGVADPVLPVRVKLTVRLCVGARVTEGEKEGDGVRRVEGVLLQVVLQVALGLEVQGTEAVRVEGVRVQRDPVGVRVPEGLQEGVQLPVGATVGGERLPVKERELLLEWVAVGVAQGLLDALLDPKGLAVPVALELAEEEAEADHVWPAETDAVCEPPVPVSVVSVLVPL